MTQPPLDRRQAPRFDIVSPLWGDIELPETARVKNVSQTGALIEASVCPTLNSRHVVTFRSNGQSIETLCVVRHVRPGPRGRSFLVGLEGVEAAIGNVVDGRLRMTGDVGPMSAFDAPPEDRRRSHRMACETSVSADISWPRPVRLADVSASGALLMSRQRGSTGARGLLRLSVGAHHFAAAIEVCRQSPFYDQSGFYLGVRFLGLIDHQRDLMDSLLSETVS